MTLLLNLPSRSYNTDGALTIKFWSRQKSHHECGTVAASARGVVMQPDGKILVVGTTLASPPARCIELAGIGPLQQRRHTRYDVR